MRRFFKSGFASAVLLMVLSAPSNAAVLDIAPGGFTVENVTTAPVDPLTAYRALVEQVGAWWPADHTWSGKASALSIKAEPGGCFCEIDGDLKVRHMEVASVQPGKLLRMVGGLGPMQGMGMHGALDWVFAPVPEGTRITLRYRVGGYDPNGFEKLAPVVDRVQGLQLGGLAAHLRAAAGK